MFKKQLIAGILISLYSPYIVGVFPHQTNNASGFADKERVQNFDYQQDAHINQNDFVNTENVQKKSREIKKNLTRRLLRYTAAAIIMAGGVYGATQIIKNLRTQRDGKEFTNNVSLSAPSIPSSSSHVLSEQSHFAGPSNKNGTSNKTIQNVSARTIHATKLLQFPAFGAVTILDIAPEPNKNLCLWPHEQDLKERFNGIPFTFGPELEKNVALSMPHGKASSLDVGMYADKGIGRDTMEDGHMIVRDLTSLNFSIKDGVKRPCFAVFDGHGGHQTACYLEKHLARNIACSIGTQKKDTTVRSFAEALTDACLVTDQHIIERQSRINEGNNLLFKDSSGATCVLAACEEDQLYVANIGDSRAVLCKAGIAQPLSMDQKPSRPDERKRIYASQGCVTKERVNGGLAVARAFGDSEYKEVNSNLVPALPEITQTTISDDMQFLILACDGLWDVMNNQEAVDFVLKGLQENKTPDAISEELVTHAIQQKKSTDNVSVMIILFNHKK